MKAVLQRILSAKLEIDNEKFSQIGKGLLILLGVEQNDNDEDIKALSDKILNLRIFEDENGKMNNSILQENGEIMVVSNFTLCADCRKGRRPSFANSESPQKAKILYEKFVDTVRSSQVKKVETGVFGADMQITLVNDGPVTIIIDSCELNKR